MTSLDDFILFVHLLGLAFGLGSATIKLALLFRCNSDHGFFHTYIKVSKPITKLLVLGMILLTVSGIGWLFTAYSFTPLLVLKVILVGIVWVLGPVIDNVAEPRVTKLIPQQGGAFSPAFVRAQKQHFILEITATALMYAITILGVLL